MADEASVEGTSSSRLSDESLMPTIEINIKTLDSHNYTFRVNKDVPVSTLKEMIVDSTGVPVEQQRLIFRGRVLQDDHLLSTYHIEDGHTLHLVARNPVQTQPGTSTEDATQNNGTESTGMPHRTGTHSVVLGSVNIADTGEGMAADISRLVGAVLNSLGAGNLAPTSSAGNASSTSSNQSRPSTEAEATQNVSGRTQPGITIINQPFQSPHVLHMPRFTPLPDSLSTLSEFVNRLEPVLQYDGTQFRSTSIRDPQTQVPSLNLRGVPTPNDLRVVLLLVQQLLSGNAAAALSHIAGRLEREGNSADPVIRGQIQSEAMHVGVAMQHLGAMFLELGRTIMTLRMGQSPAEALVNAGPAIYISPAGPNPIMVQPNPLQTSSMFGIPPPSMLNGNSGPFGVGDLPRNVSIQIHAGTSVPPSVSSSGSRVNLGGAVPAERLNVQQTSTSGTGSNDSGPTRGLPSRSVRASIPARSTGETATARHVVSVMYPVQVRSHQMVPINQSSVQASQPSSNGGTQPNATSAVPASPSESDATSTLAAQISAQIASALSGNLQGLSSSSSSMGYSDSQGSHPSTTYMAQPNLTSQFPHSLSETGTISQIVTQLTSQFANVLSGNAQGPSSSPNVQRTDTSSTDGSQVAPPASVSSVVANDDGTRDGGSAVSEPSGSSFAKSLVHDADMPGSVGQEAENPVPSENAQHLERMDAGSSTTRSLNDPATSGAGDIVTSNTGSQSLVISAESSTTKGSESDRPAPLGLGLGGLQPKRRGRPVKPMGKDAMSNSTPSAGQNQQSVARGQQVLRSLVAQNSDRKRENANGSSTQLPSVMSQISDAMPLGERGTGQIDSTMISQALQSPALSSLLTGVAERAGLGSPATLTSMLEQCTQSPGIMNALNETMQQVGQSDDIGGLLSGMGRGNGGIDFSRIIQQMMPVVSQVLGGGRTFSAPMPGVQSELHDESTGGNGMPDVRHSQIDVHQAVQRIEQNDAPGNVFRSMLESAGRLVGEGTSFADLVEELGNNVELTDEFMEMFRDEVSQRLQTESVPEDKS